MKDRIIQIMEVERLTPSSFADKLHVGRAVVSHILNGRNNPSLDVVMRILDAMPYIDSDWLLMGKGNMRKEDNILAKAPDLSSNLKNPDLFENLSTEKGDELSTLTNVSIEESSASSPKDAVVNSTVGAIEREYQDQSLHTIVGSDKTVSKIIIYYSDKTFQAFNPSPDGF